MTTFIVIASCIVAIILSQIVYIYINGTHIPAPTIPRNTQTVGKGSNLQFVVMGDSTAIGQGADYTDSVAWQSAEYLAEQHTVSLTNLGESGARTAAMTDQAQKAAKLQPDLVMIFVGANDVTHFTKLADVDNSLRQAVAALRSTNPNVHIIFTGSPDMGSAPRFPWLVQQLAMHRTQKVNAIIQHVADATNCKRVRIAEETGRIFRSHPELFASDKFHPNKDGYKVWMPSITASLDAWRSTL